MPCVVTKVRAINLTRRRYSAEQGPGYLTLARECTSLQFNTDRVSLPIAELLLPTEHVLTHAEVREDALRHRLERIVLGQLMLDEIAPLV